MRLCAVGIIAGGPDMSQQVHAMRSRHGARRQRRTRGRSALRSKPGTARDPVADREIRLETIAVFLGILAGVSGVAALTVNGYLSYWVAIPINAVLIYFIFTPLHEAVHGNIVPANSRLKWLEWVIGNISGYVLIAPYPGFRVLHLHHHNHTNDAAEDPDYWVRDNNYFRVILRCMVIQPVYVIHLWLIARDPRDDARLLVRDGASGGLCSDHLGRFCVRLWMGAAAALDTARLYRRGDVPADVRLASPSSAQRARALHRFRRPSVSEALNGSSIRSSADTPIT